MPEVDNDFGTSAEGKDLLQQQIADDQGPEDMPGLIRTGSLSPKTREMETDGASLSPGDKKRSKLGYHRTAVACGHCRRRKIRCIPAFDDPSGRCQNCIRLKKDCHFFPVDQQNPTPGKRLRSATKTSEGFLNEGDTSVSSSSPGAILRSTSTEQMSHKDSTQETPPLPAESPGLHGYNPSRSMSVQGLDFPHSYDTSQHHNTHMQPPYSPRGYGIGSTSSHFYPQHYGHSLPAHYSSAFTTGSLSATTTSLAQESIYDHQVPISNGTYSWDQPTRPGDTNEGLAIGFSNPYRTNTYPSFERRITNQAQQYPPTSSSFASAGMNSGSGLPHGVFREPSSYEPLQMTMHNAWSAGDAVQAQQVTAVGRGSYNQGWYQPNSSLLETSQAESHPQILPSTNHNLLERQHKPG